MNTAIKLTDGGTGNPAARWLDSQDMARARKVLRDMRKRARTVEAGVHLLAEGSEAPEVIVLFDGWLSLYKTLSEGHAQIIDFAMPFDILHTASANGHTAACGVQAITRTTFQSIDAGRWERLLRDEPAIATLEVRLARAARARLTERLLRLGQADATTRVAYTLIELCLRLDARDPNGDCRYHMPLTQQQLGQFTGLTSVHVCRVLGRLGRDGLIETSDHMDIRVCDPWALAALASVDVDSLAGEILPPLA